MDVESSLFEFCAKNYTGGLPALSQRFRVREPESGTREFQLKLYFLFLEA